MELRKLTTPLILLGLFAAFGLVCTMVWLHKGKSAKWVARKMVIGASILSLTAITTGCPVVTCYDPVEPNRFSFDSINEYGEIVVDLPNDSVVSGTAYGVDRDNFLFTVMKNDTLVVDFGTINPVDGAFDSSPEKFSLTLNSTLDTGIYALRVQTAITNNDKKDTIDWERHTLIIK
jgi:hypothetical protein